MTRLTKAARAAIEQEQARVADAAFENTLHDRLMALFADITSEGLELVVRKNKDGVLVFLCSRSAITSAGRIRNSTST